MVDLIQSRSSVVPRRVFYNARELRAGWRLFIFLAIVSALLAVNNVAVRRLPHIGNGTAMYLFRETMRFFVFVLASWIMGRMEHRTIADYGLPGRNMFRAQFWQGALLGFAAITGLLVALRIAGVFHFAGIALHGAEVWKWGTIWLLIFVFGRSARGVSRSRLRALHAYNRDRLLACCNSYLAVLRIHSLRQRRRGLGRIV